MGHKTKQNRSSVHGLSQTDRYENNLHPPLVAEIIRGLRCLLLQVGVNLLCMVRLECLLSEKAGIEGINKNCHKYQSVVLLHTLIHLLSIHLDNQH